MSDKGLDEATRICARLLREGSVARAEIPALAMAEIRQDVEQRLLSVGLMLATTPTSDHVGLRLAPEVTADARLDVASHLGLRPEACALLVILWVRLVLQKRSGSGAAEPPRVPLESLVRDFQPVLGGRSRIRSLVQELRRLRFLGGSGEEIEAAPLLELAIDGERIMSFLRRDVLAGLRDEPETEPAPPATERPQGLGGEVLAIIERLGGTSTMGDLSRLTNEPASRLRRILHELQNAGWVRRTGERAGTRYHLTHRPKS
jgi:hypothetical protein